MNRRILLKRAAAGMTALSSTALSGCSGDGDDETTDAGEGSDGATPDSSEGGDDGTATETDSDDVTERSDDGTDPETDTQTEESSIPGELGENTIEELTITGFSVANAYPESFRVEVTVQNEGEKTVSLSDHGFGLVTYDVDGNDISTDGSGTLEADDVAPGETGTLIVTMSFTGSTSTDAIARYEVTLTCGRFDDEGYCADQGTDTPTETATEEPVASSLPTYEFTEGESYTYDANFAGQESEETWLVTSVDGGNVTIERETVSDGETYTQSISGTLSNIYDRVQAERDISYFPLLRSSLKYKQEGDLTAGNSFSIRSTHESDNWETATVEVAGETTVNGVTCTEFSVIADSIDETQTICVADGYPFAVSLLFEQNGERLLEMTLVESNRP